MELLPDLAIDAIANLEHALAVGLLNRVRCDVRHPRQKPLVLAVVRLPGPHEGQGRPRLAAPPDRRDRQIIRTGGTLHADEARQQLEIPGAGPGYGEEHLRPRIAVPRDRDASGVGAEHLARLAQDVSDGVLGILHVLQVARQPIEKPEGVEFSLQGRHRQNADFMIEPRLRPHLSGGRAPPSPLRSQFPCPALQVWPAQALRPARS